MYPFTYTVRGRYNAVSFLNKIFTLDTPELAREGEIWIVFCESKLWLYSAPVNAVVCEISSYIESRYNDTSLYVAGRLGRLWNAYRTQNVSIHYHLPMRPWCHGNAFCLDSCFGGECIGASSEVFSLKEPTNSLIFFDIDKHPAHLVDCRVHHRISTNPSNYIKKIMFHKS